MSLKIPITKEIIEDIRRKYAEIVAKEVPRINDPNNINEVPKIISEIQNILNDFAKASYDKYGRIIIRVGPGEYDYLDITSPRLKVSQSKAMVYFLETNIKGVPIKNPTELE